MGVEVTGLEEHITYPIRNYAVMHSLTQIQLVELKARAGKGVFSGSSGSKVGRARGVIPLYQQGLIKHNFHACAELEAQELSFPRPARWDVLDCAAYLPQMLELGLRYMHPLDKASEEVLAQRFEEECEKLKYQPALDNDWKTV